MVVLSLKYTCFVDVTSGKQIYYFDPTPRLDLPNKDVVLRSVGTMPMVIRIKLCNVHSASNCDQ